MDAGSEFALAGDFGASLFRKRDKECFVFAGQVGEGGKVLDGVRLKLFFEKREKCFADSGTEPGDVLVGGVFAPLLLFCA